MPTYSYECTECGDRFDIVQAFTDDALTVCEKCSGRLRKRFNSVGIVFKGSGFYRTDSRESAKTTAKGTDGATASAGSSGNGSTEGSGSSDKSGSADKKSGSAEKSASSSSTPSPAAASS